MKIINNIYVALVVFVTCLACFCYSIFHYEIAKVSNDNALKEIIIEQGSVSSISDTLYQEHLIKNKFFFKIYVKLTGKSNLKAATYKLSENMGVEKIVDILYSGKGSSSEEIKITFKEGIKIRKIAKIIDENTNHTEDEVINTINDKIYLNKLIDKYWFLTNNILNDEIYYALEGYLYPNTYHISSKDEKIETIIEMMLDEEEKKLEKYKDKINDNTLSIHEIFTFASILELEGTTLENRRGIAGVFNNRLEKGMNLGSDVTTYYGARIDMGERDLYSKEVNECNSYNTRCATFKKLPISPICNSSIETIEAVIEPEVNDYYYFVADKNKQIYFSRNITEHNNTIASLKREGKWYEY